MPSKWTLIWQLEDSFEDIPFSIAHYLDLENHKLKQVTEINAVIEEREITCLITLNEITKGYMDDLQEIYRTKLQELKSKYLKVCGQCRYYMDSLEPDDLNTGLEMIDKW
jgi:hypothetical protein